MPKEVETVINIEAPAEALWALRLDQGFDEYLAEQEGQVFTMVSYDEANDDAGEVVIDRKIALNFKSNPIPKALREDLVDLEWCRAISS